MEVQWYNNTRASVDVFVLLQFGQIGFYENASLKPKSPAKPKYKKFP